jgi:hypothetical protein
MLPERPPLTLERLRLRIEAHAYNHYWNLAALIKSGVFAVAAGVLLDILIAPDRFTPLRIAFWIASLGLAFITYCTWTRGTVLIGNKHNVLDIAWPLLLGIVEYCLFIAIAPRVQRLDFWYCAAAAHGILGALLVTNRLHQTKLEEDFDKQTVPLGQSYLNWIRSDRLGAAITGLINVGIFILVLLCKDAASEPIGYYLQFSWAVLLFIGACKVSYDASEQYRTISNFVLENMTAKSRRSGE